MLGAGGEVLGAGGGMSWLVGAQGTLARLLEGMDATAQAKQAYWA